MIKHLSIIGMSVVLLTACGGSDDKKTNASSSSSSVSSASSSSVSSAAPVSSDSSSLSSSSSSVSSSSSSAPSSSSSSSLSLSSSVSSTPAPNKVLKIDVTNAGSMEWHLQLQQVIAVGVGHGLDVNKTYKFSYKIKTSVPKTIPVIISTGDPDYISFPTNMVNVDAITEWQTKTLTIVPTLTDSSISLQVNLAANGTYQIWLDDISLTDADGTNEQITNGSIVRADDWFLGVNGGGAAGTLTIEDEAL